MKNRFYLVLVIAALVCLAGWTARAEYTRNVPIKIWEYQQLEFDMHVDTSKLNELGNAGWELVGVTSSCPSNPKNSVDCKYSAYLKRER